MAMQIENCNEEILTKEKQKLRKLESHVLIEYIKSSVEILMSLKSENFDKSYQLSKKKKSPTESLDNTPSENTT